MRGFALGSACVLMLAALPAQAVTINFQPGANQLVSFNKATGTFTQNPNVKIFENFDGNGSGKAAYTLAPTAGAETAANRRGIALIGPNTAFTTGPGNTIVPTTTTSANVYNTRGTETGTGEGARPFVQSATNAGTPLSERNFASIQPGGRFVVNFNDYFPSKPVHVFSFALGSVDPGNTVTLYFNDNTSRTFAGTELTGDTLTASQVDARTNGRVTFDTRGLNGGMKGAVFSLSGTNPAFEFDGFAGAAPEPATWGMMILGFGLAGYGLRRNRQPAIA